MVILDKIKPHFVYLNRIFYRTKHTEQTIGT